MMDSMLQCKCCRDNSSQILFFLVLRYFFELILRLQLKVYCKSNLERVPRSFKMYVPYAQIVIALKCILFIVVVEAYAKAVSVLLRLYFGGLLIVILTLDFYGLCCTKRLCCLFPVTRHQRTPISLDFSFESLYQHADKAFYGQKYDKQFTISVPFIL